ncbi:hypothetical protein H7849_16690 [Alloacidobacterium dinghuense]|uniref:Alpha-galactosidase n=1 Tax=Alloacidobacterium dinghuense TaxID=2763107 RepID=A0A7G8BDX9_9BACT|nr:hypothetical protein [Alloacidobacterium dinghuense]QNI30749.1 hypothetical protein H7849_16690 [Alloacidobacterium dinghuense]
MIKMVRNAVIAVVFGASSLLFAQSPQKFSADKLGSPTLRDPISVYNNWSSYDELSDNIPLTQELAMRELNEVLRLRKLGVRFDYYMMDAFWFDPDGGYRTWRKPNWPNGPDIWIKTCQQNGIRPGMWFSSNTLVKINAAAAWRDSLNKQGTAMSFYEGGFLPDFMNTLQYWYDQGIRMFKFDFVDLTVAPAKDEGRLSKDEIIQRNTNALRGALASFRAKNPDVVLEAFNGFGGDMDSTYYPFPFRSPVDLRWLEVFDAQYAGDPRPSDVPEMSFWRSMDIYSDHQVRRYEQAHLPIERIDSTGFMVGKTGTIYYRAMHAWKSALILMMARGGWMDTTHGNLELISEDDARWFARVQSLYLHFQSEGRIKSFGGIPGEVQPYGFGALDADGSVYVVMNPAQEIARVAMPLLSQVQKPLGEGRILFRDAGFVPPLSGDSIELGPGQMAMVGFGKYATSAFDFGIQQDVVIPRSIRPVAAEFHETGKGTIQATIPAPKGGDLRLIMQQYSPDGSLRRTWAGGPPSGTNMGKVFLLEATQNGKQLPIREDYDKIVWSGLSWAIGEVSAKDVSANQPLTLTFQSMEKDPVTLKGTLYVVNY